MTIRGAAFWALDRARGGTILRNVEEIDALTSQPLAGRVDQMLAAQLEHATKNVPYYRDLRATTDLSEFPVVDKAIIRAAGDRTVATGTAVSDCAVVSTSGSTGTPFTLLHDPTKRRRVAADAIYWGRRAGYEIGVPLVHMKVWSDRNRIGLLPRLARNVLPVDTTHRTEAELLAIADHAARRRPVSIISYASSLNLLARAVDDAVAQGRDPGSLPRIASIVGQSEHLPSDARRTLRQHLGVDPVSRYGLEELGIVAQQDPNGGDSFVINSASAVVEILSTDSADSVGPGEVGRIVVTELVNRAQPLIRYDTGDLGALRVDEHGRADGRALSVIEGRRLDQVFDVDDRPLTTMVMYNLWWRFPEIRQYQLVQRGRGDYLLRLNVEQGFDRQTEIVSRFKEIVGQPATVDLELTDEDFVLSSGKRKSVVSNYTPSSES